MSEKMRLIPEIEFKVLCGSAILPVFRSPTSIFAELLSPDEFEIPSGEHFMLDLLFSYKVPEDIALLVLPHTALSYKGVICQACSGSRDCDEWQQITLMMSNSSRTSVKIQERTPVGVITAVSAFPFGIKRA